MVARWNVRLWPPRAFQLAAGLLVPGLLGAAAEPAIQYGLERTRPLSRFNARQIALLEKLNRADRSHLGRLKMLIVPSRWDLDELAYSPLPQMEPELRSTPKAIMVDVPFQAFGAYEHGNLVRWGPVSTGGRSSQTPPGRYALHWSARVRISSVDPT